VGDWVVVSMFDGERKAIIHEVLPRHSRIARKVAGKKQQEQVIAANIDTLFVVQSLDNNFNLRRLERYLVLAREGGVAPVVILSKADLCPNPDEKQRQVRTVSGDAPVLVTSAESSDGLPTLRQMLRPGLTYAFVGSSGVGKSTLINRLAGAELLKTAAVRDVDAKGRHTTTHRELIVLPEGALLIDTPGMREMQLWDAAEGMDDAFADIIELTAQCRFADCSHTTEKGCAVLLAVEAGDLPPERYQSFLKLAKEAAFHENRQEQQAFLETKRKHKQMSRLIKNYRKHHDQKR
jgi:ribosome biogenesis GTPase